MNATIELDPNNTLCFVWSDRSHRHHVRMLITIADFEDWEPAIATFQISHEKNVAPLIDIPFEYSTERTD
jgi:hypothetical protein